MESYLREQRKFSPQKLFVFGRGVKVIEGSVLLQFDNIFTLLKIPLIEDCKER
jgi:hypothetical protein